MVRHGELDPVEYACEQWPFLNHAQHGILLDNFQQEMLRAAFLDQQTREIRIKGCHKAGKGTATAMIACIWFRVFPESRVIVTSNKFEHARDNMFGELLKWRKTMVDPGLGENGRVGIFDHERHYVAVANPAKGEGFSGHHGPATLFCFDEASGVPDEFYNLALSQGKIVALSNPRSITGWFHRGWRRWMSGDVDRTEVVELPSGRTVHLFTVAAGQLRNVRENVEVIPNQLTRTIFEEFQREWSTQRCRVFLSGQFPEEDLDLQIVTSRMVESAVVVWHKELRVFCFGLDIGLSLEGDRTVLAVGGAEGCFALHEWRTDNAPTIAEKVVTIAESRYGINLRRGENPIVVDMGGPGGPVANMLANEGVKVVEDRGNDRPDNREEYVNRRAENYGELAKRLDPDGRWRGEPWAIPDDPELHEELMAPQKLPGTDLTKFAITPKTRQGREGFKGQTVTEMIGRSPDKADAICYLYRAVRETAVAEAEVGFVRAAQVQSETAEQFWEDVYKSAGY